jgi:hypothetical protein
MWEAPSSDSFKKTYPRGMNREPRYRWVIVALGALMGCVSIGALFSLAVFQTPMSQTTEWSRAGISAAMSIKFFFLELGCLVFVCVR